MVAYSVVIPVYRGEKTIERLFNEIKVFFDRYKRNFEVIFVFDCGPDDSWNIMQELRQKFPGLIKCIKLSRNFGQHNATICGFKYATGDFILTLDEDMQHSPADIGLLIEEQKKKNYDVVYGNYTERKHSGYRNISSSVIKKLLALSIPELHPHYSSFRIIKSSIAKETLGMNNSYTFLDGYFSWITTHVSSCEVTHAESEAGKSAYNFKKLLQHSINIFFTFSNLPIRLLIYLSFFVFSVSFIFSIYVFVRKLMFNDIIPGYTTFSILGGLGVGVILFGLGIIGEYLQRVNIKTTKRPNFVESDIL